MHRLLAIAIGADMTYPELLSRKSMQQVCNNLNYRHKMSQYAQRSSVALHTHLFFRQKVQDEDAYVLFVRQNALQVLIPKYGLEGSIYLKEKDSDASPCTYNPEVSFYYSIFLLFFFSFFYLFTIDFIIHALFVYLLNITIFDSKHQ